MKKPKVKVTIIRSKGQPPAVLVQRVPDNGKPVKSRKAEYDKPFDGINVKEAKPFDEVGETMLTHRSSKPDYDKQFDGVKVKETKPFEEVTPTMPKMYKIQNPNIRITPKRPRIS